jgi:hypothetical protein
MALHLQMTTLSYRRLSRECGAICASPADAGYKLSQLLVLIQ